MNERNASRRHIIRSTSIIGGASLVNVAASVLRQKVAALVLGPSGVGLIGLFQGLVSTATILAALGIGSSGARQVASAVGSGDEQEIAAARQALFWGACVLALAGAASVWAFRSQLALWLLSDASLGDEVAWLSLAVAFSVATFAQGALLTGLGRIGDLARITVASALLSAVSGVCLLLFFGFRGIVAFVITTPLAGFLVGWFILSRNGERVRIKLSLSPLLKRWRILAYLGVAVMVGNVALQAGHLLVRATVQNQIGVVQLGYFQAVLALSLGYMPLLMAPINADFYPRLTAAISAGKRVSFMTNEQTEVALLLAGPLMLAMIGSAPWLLDLLYSTEFRPAASLFRLQLLGDLVRLAAWPLACLMLASGAGKTFAATEIGVMSLYVGAAHFGIPALGLNAVGAANLAASLGYLAWLMMLSHRKFGVRWSPATAGIALLLVALASVILLASEANAIGGLALAGLCAAGMILLAARRLPPALPGRAGAALSWIRGRLGQKGP